MQQRYVKHIYISPVGRSGNQLFQYLLALFFQKHVPYAEIFHLHTTNSFLLDAFGIKGIARAPMLQQHPYRVLVVDRHNFDVRSLIANWMSPADTIIHIKTLACRMELFFPLRKHYQDLFSTILDTVVHGWDESKLVINIRLEDILSSSSSTTIHKNYPPLPFSFYHWILKKTKLTPVFLGQLGDDQISNRLRSCFPNATFCPSQGTRIDFDIMRHSKHVLTSVSTFSYLACFLSKTCVSIHVPVYGFFHPKDRPDCNFIVHDDGIFHYYNIPSMLWEASDEQITKLTQIHEDEEYDMIHVTDTVSKHVESPLNMPLLKHLTP